MSLRYGTIMPKNILSLLPFCIVMYIASVIFFAIDWIVMGIFNFVIPSFFLLAYVLPMLEWYQIQSGTIETKRIVSRESINIPAETILIITRADIIPKFSNEPLLLKNCLAITILQDVTLEGTLELLSQSHTSHLFPYYTNSSIRQKANKKNYVYSMLYKNNIIPKLLQFTNATIIIPEYLSSEIPLSEINANVYIDSHPA